MNIAGTQGAAFQIAELIEHEEWMVAGAGVVTVSDAVLLLAMGRTEARIHVEHDSSRRTATMDGIDPTARQIGEDDVIAYCLDQTLPAPASGSILSDAPASFGDTVVEVNGGPSIPLQAALARHLIQTGFQRVGLD